MILRFLTWNLEGLRRSIFSLKYLLDLSSPEICLLSEPNTFSHDMSPLMSHLSDKYCWYLNCEDLYDLDAPLIKNKTYGGTMALWKHCLDPFISIHKVSSPSILPVIYSPPGAATSVHIAIYLPTSGKENDFIEELLNLKIAIEELRDKFKNPDIFIRGDSNVNSNNKARAKIFATFCSEMCLKHVLIEHKTYHHFLGNGLFNSNIDIILHSNSIKYPESVTKIFCQDEYPYLCSHHDPILSEVAIPKKAKDTSENDDFPKAPTVKNLRHKITWSDDMAPDYQARIAPVLSKIRGDWSIPNSVASLSILLDITNSALSLAAKETHGFKSLNLAHKNKKRRTTKMIILARKDLHSSHKALKKSPLDVLAKQEFTRARKGYRFLCRKEVHKRDVARDSELFSISDPLSTTVFRTVRSSKSSSSRPIPFLTVRDKTYPGDRVGDGLFDSISTLKTQDPAVLSAIPNYHSWLQDYRYILEICKNRRDIPIISLEHSTNILKRMKSSVIDFWSITPLHFINAGREGLDHFNYLMNAIITNVNAAGVKELNTVLALLLHKAHGKSLTSDRSYRTISNCPVLAKALDIYIHDLFIDLWNHDQAPTQYQGENSSHELASLLITEAVQHSLFTSKKPVFILFLDARSAFDTVVIQFLIRNLYLMGMSGNSILYINNRLLNRITFCEWEQKLMGPIYDQHGLEQGGCNSSDLYKVYNNDLLKLLQRSEQGVEFGNGLTISSVGQADDVAILSNDINNLRNLLNLTLSYCKRFNIELCAGKTKLLNITSNKTSSPMLNNPIAISDQIIPFSDNAVHVGVVHASDNLPHLVDRIHSHKKAIGAILFTGLARCHRGNTAAAIKMEKLYCLPVLFSGLASLVLSSNDVNLINQHYKSVISNLLKLYRGTPNSFIYFIAGTLPGQAILHLRQLSLFNMICQLPKDPLHTRAKAALSTCQRSDKSWFTQVRDLCLQYGLPHPLHLINKPLPKFEFRKLARSKVVDFWESKLRSEASSLDSLAYFKPEFHSLLHPHPILWTAGSNPYEVSKAIIQCRMLSGRYRTESLASHWSLNTPGFCLASTCTQIEESLEHILLHCPSYHPARNKVVKLWKSTKSPIILQLTNTVLAGSSANLLQFILDPSTNPVVIRMSQEYGQEPLKIVFHLTRTWCFSIHKSRAKLLGRWAP